MEYVWSMYGVSMEYLWSMYGVSSEEEQTESIEKSPSLCTKDKMSIGWEKGS